MYKVIFILKIDENYKFILLITLGIEYIINKYKMTDFTEELIPEEEIPEELTDVNNPTLSENFDSHEKEISESFNRLISFLENVDLLEDQNKYYYKPSGEQRCYELLEQTDPDIIDEDEDPEVDTDILIPNPPTTQNIREILTNCLSYSIVIMLLAITLQSWYVIFLSEQEKI